MKMYEIVKDILENYIKKYLSPTTLIILLLLGVTNWAGYESIQSFLSNGINSSRDRIFALVIEIFLLFSSFLVATFFIYKDRKKTKNTLPDTVNDTARQNNAVIPHNSLSRVNAYIVQSEDAQERDAKFVKINQNVKRTYWVFGTTLNSIVVRHENMLKSMAKKGIEIKLCMMAPAVAAKGVCQSSIKDNKCNLYNICFEYFESMKGSDFDPTDTRKKFRAFEKNFRKFKRNDKETDDYLSIYNALIDSRHIKEYFSTATDYSQKLQASKKDIFDIITAIQDQYTNTQIDLKTKRSFIPMSITIADAAEEYGELVVEFHVPFTSSKVLIEIDRQEHEELFQVFVRFFKKIWNESDDKD